jgi:hypothetical protein
MRRPNRKKKMISADIVAADKPIKRKVQFSIHLTPMGAKMAEALRERFGYVYDSEVFEKLVRERYAQELPRGTTEALPPSERS